MKKAAPFIALLAVISLIAGYLLSQVSWIGRVGIRFFYQEYGFLRVWWKGAGVIFIVLFLLFLIQMLAQRKLPRGAAIITHIVCLLGALAGLYATYHDFRHSLSHKLLAERFHLGVYLFWIGWMMVCLYFLLQRRTFVATDANNKDASKP